MQRMSSLERRKEVVSGRRGGMCGRATKDAARRVEEESGICLTTKGAGALWGGYSRWGIPVRVGVVHKRGYSVIRGV